MVKITQADSSFSYKLPLFTGSPFHTILLKNALPKFSHAIKKKMGKMGSYYFKKQREKMILSDLTEFSSSQFHFLGEIENGKSGSFDLKMLCFPVFFLS